MDDVAAVTEMDCCNNLLELLPGIFFRHTPMSHQVVCTYTNTVKFILYTDILVLSCIVQYIGSEPMVLF